MSSTRVTRLKASPATSRSTSSEDLVACQRIGRQARLIKLDPKVVDTIILPWPAISGGAATLDGDGRSYEEIAAGREAAAA